MTIARGRGTRFAQFPATMPTPDPLWYKDAVIYQLHVRAFHDSSGTGYGDFPGLTKKLDYLQDLGVTTLWLLPFYPSPLRDDGYDIADYTDVNPQYGRLDDFKEFLAEAHRRDLRVVTELVLNHTSDRHPWFQRARIAPKGSPERDFYVWSDTPDKYAGVRIIFPDYERSNWTWDPLAGQYYWHRFFHHQPDLNFDNPAVWDAIFPVLDFWLEMGVDGMRLDAIPYLYEREGTNCENLPEGHVFLKALRKRMDEKFPGRMFLAEANQWPEDVLPYFGDGDECQMAFHFPVMPRLYMALHQEDRFPILDILEQTPPIPENCQWCTFLRNHDELTLEMVTDEERDYMYRAYAEDRTARINLGIRRRLAPLLKNDRRRIELMNALLFSLPGTPVVYYGDEIGMGDNIYLGDRNGVRTPMQWSGDRNAGFGRSNPQKLYLPVVIDPEYHYEAVNVETQQNNPSSLLWWTKRLIALRKRFKAFGRGTIRFLRPANPKVLAFVREYGDERLLVVANLSRFVQFAELDLKEFAGVAPEEVFGRTRFPVIGDAPYRLTLGPHGFFWFSLPAAGPVVVDHHAALDLPALPGGLTLDERFEPAGLDPFEAVLPEYLGRTGLAGAPTVTAAHVRSVVRVGRDVPVWFLLVAAEYREGVPELLWLPVAFVPTVELGDLAAPLADVGLARIPGPEAGVLVEALAVPARARAVVRAVMEKRVRVVPDGELRFPADDLPPDLDPDTLPVAVRRTGRHTLSVTYGDRLVLKTYRRVDDGASPAVEVGRALAGKPGFAPVAGAVEYRRRGAAPATLAVLYHYVEHQGTAWQHALDELSRYFERVAAVSPDATPDPAELVGGFGETARTLGRRTAEMHLALVDPANGTAFAPEPFGKLYQRSIYQEMRNTAGRVVRRLRTEADRYPAAAELLDRTHRLDEVFRGVLDPGLGGARIRVHGDYHLGRLLHTGRDFVVTDFDGDTIRTVEERRVKRSPLRDVAGMVRSFDYAARSVLLGLENRKGRAQGVIRAEDVTALTPWAEAWSRRVAAEFVAAYTEAMAGSNLLPTSEDGRRALLAAVLLERGLHELDTELTADPPRAAVPLAGLLAMLGPA